MKSTNPLLIAALFFWVSEAFGQGERCNALAQAIEHSHKEIAMVKWAESLFDNSAPRATMRELQINSQLQLIAMNLVLMQQNKCAPLDRPIDLGTAYITDALACLSARQKTPSGSREQPAECNYANWQRKQK